MLRHQEGGGPTEVQVVPKGRVHGELVGLRSNARREAMKKFNLKGGKESIEGGSRRAALLQAPTSDNELRRGAMLEINLL
eukprot:2185367-Prorocentrum_lima.AAC.1